MPPSELVPISETQWRCAVLCGSLFLSVIIPTIDEPDSLQLAVNTLLAQPRLGIAEILLIVCDKTSKETFEACTRLRKTHGERVKVVHQSLARLGGAFRSGIAAAVGSHILLMFADLESDPNAVQALVAAAKVNPGSVVSASRWINGGGFVDYGRWKLFLNYLFQHLCAIVSNSHLTDFTYGFRLYPSIVLKNTKWDEIDHAFVLEAILKPVIDSVPVCEVPAIWRPRKEGKRLHRYRQYLQYIPTLLRIVVARLHHKPLRSNREGMVVNGRGNLDAFPGAVAESVLVGNPNDQFHSDN